jgi:phage tail sheath protein FI
MAFQLSPGVNVSEIDLTTVVPAVGTSEGAFAGRFSWGPIDQIVTVASEIELADKFGKPNDNTAVNFFSAANFLAYGKNLKIVRAANTASYKNSCGNTNPVLIKNQDDYMLNYRDMQAPNNAGHFAAKYPGGLGDSITVSALVDGTSFGTWDYKTEFDAAPGTSTYVGNQSGSNDEMHIIVIDRYGRFTGVAGTVLEKFPFVSAASDAKNEDGSSNYYVDVIAKKSKYIWVINHPPGSNFGGPAFNATFDFGDLSIIDENMSGGVAGVVTNGQIEQAYDKFANADEVDVSLIVTGGAAQAVSEYIVDNIAESRKDCVVFISPEIAQAVDNAGSEVDDIKTYRNDFNSSSYAFMDSGWKYQYDKYNNVYRWIPLNGDIAGLCVRTDQQRDPWFSPAGFNRGQIKNVVKLSWNPNKTQRDELYKIGVNPVVSFAGEGVVLYGDKTMLSKPSAFDRINVRRLFIVLEKAIAKASKYSLFEFNDEFTRAQFVALIEPFLRDVQGRRGIYDFRVVCDETNNTPEVIDRNEFIGDIYIKPARSINFIQLNFVAVRTGVAFDEIVGKF